MILPEISTSIPTPSFHPIIMSQAYRQLKKVQSTPTFYNCIDLIKAEPSFIRYIPKDYYWNVNTSSLKKIKFKNSKKSITDIDAFFKCAVSNYCVKYGMYEKSLSEAKSLAVFQLLCDFIEYCGLHTNYTECKCCNALLVDRLLKYSDMRGYDIVKITTTKYGRNGNTLLHQAARLGCVESVKVLLNANSDPNCLNNIDETPLVDAALYGHIEVVKVLLDSGAKIDDIVMDYTQNYNNLAYGMKNKDILVKLLKCEKSKSKDIIT